MPIVRKRPPPAAGPDKIGNAIRDLWPVVHPASALGGTAVDLSQPLPVYSLGLEDIRGTGYIAKAKPVGWRYLLQHADSVAYADLREVPGGGQEFSSLSRNQNAERLNEAAHLAEQVAATLADCEARLLDIPALQESALWLFGPDARFIPYVDPERLRGPNAVVSVDPEFLMRMSRRAEHLRQHLAPPDRREAGA